jgi:hypothetical protein
MINMGIDLAGLHGIERCSVAHQKVRRQNSFMGDIDNKDVDHDGWTREDCRTAVRRHVIGAAPNILSLHHPGWSRLRLSGRLRGFV